MKQFPSNKQWMEISFKQRVDLLVSYGTFDRKYLESEVHVDMCNHMSNIGQMIEYIGDDWLQLITEWCDDCKVVVAPDNKNLCDALWEVVKAKTAKITSSS